MEKALFYDCPEVVDADLADYFGSIPRSELMRSLARRIADGRVLHLIKMRVECAVEDTDDRGQGQRAASRRARWCSLRAQPGPIKNELARISSLPNRPGANTP